MMRRNLHKRNHKIAIRSALLSFGRSVLIRTKITPSKAVVPMLAVERSLRSENSLGAYPVIEASVG